MPQRLPRRLRKPHHGDDLRAVVDETAALFHRLAWVADEIYGDEGRGTARRGILRGLARYGPATVPALARARSVRRQTIQPVVDALVADGLAELVDNPAHATSRLVKVTAAGVVIVQRMDRTDRRVLAAVGADVDARAIAVTARTLRALRTRFETQLRWRAAAEAEGGERRRRGE